MPYMHAVDTATWPGRGLYEHYRNDHHPFLCLRTEIDISGFLDFIRTRELPFTLCALYLILHTANRQKSMTYRVVDGRVVSMYPLRAAMRRMRGAHHFTYRLLDFYHDFPDFLDQARQRLKVENVEFAGYAQRQPMADVIEVTELRGASLTADTLPQRWVQHDSVPRLIFGAWSQQAERASLPLALEVNQAFVDKRDASRYLQQLESAFADASALSGR
ncbi:MAG: hypothetical protein Tsb002_22830 [Wenzhouxiangellaceae bacterium]